VSRHHNVGQIQSKKKANRSLAIVARLKYLEMTLVNKIFIHEEIKGQSKFG
jgi:hypothetical protein